MNQQPQYNANDLQRAAALFMSQQQAHAAVSQAQQNPPSPSHSPRSAPRTPASVVQAAAANLAAAAMRITQSNAMHQNPLVTTSRYVYKRCRECGCPVLLG